MEPRHIRLPSSNHLQDISGSHAHRRCDGRSAPDRHAGSLPMNMQVPNRRLDVPPPLPPPRYVNNGPPEDDDGPSWGYGPSGHYLESRRPSGGGSFPRSWDQRIDEEKYSGRSDYHRRESAIAPSSWTRSPTDSEKRYEAMRFQDEGYYSLSGPSPVVQHLPGEKQLHHRDQEKSSQAYDKNLLSKIGKPTTSPSRSSALGSVDSSPTSVLSFSQRQPNQFRSLSYPTSVTSSLSDPLIKQEPSGRFADSPHSRPPSPPSLKSKPFTDFRSPTYEHSSRSSTVDSDIFPQPSQRFPTSINISRQQKSRRSGSSGSLLAKVDESAAGYANADPAKRENYSQPIFSEQDSTVRMADEVRHLHLDDRIPSSSHPDTTTFRLSDTFNPHCTSMSRPAGIKRKLPPEERQNEAQAAASLTQQAARVQEFLNSPQHFPAQNTGQYGYHQGSISSQSSGTYSYAISGGPSVGDSSYRSTDQHSPGRISPTSDAQLYPHTNSQDSQYPSMPMNATSQTPRAGPYPQPPGSTNSPQKSQPSSRKQSQASGQPPYSCSCCVKKPKKFQTLEELQQHQSEKSYECDICRNRFKNKNEAERHKNSIHRRTNSWTCAELDRYEEAFFPAAAFLATTTGGGQFQPNPQAANGGSPADLCGYCGDEFSNEPKDLEARYQHLITRHKWGDCNKGKKFYRADHFRQHLKHSHGGKTGKHTNALEQRCARDETPQISSDNSQSSTPTQAPSAPVANMGNLRPMPHMVPPGTNQQDLSQAHIQQQISKQGTMAPPSLMPMDMSNIDPSINYMPLQHQQQMQQLQGAAGGGHDYKPEGV